MVPPNPRPITRLVLPTLAGSPGDSIRDEGGDSTLADDLISVEQAAPLIWNARDRKYGVDPKTVHVFLRDGRIPGSRKLDESAAARGKPGVPWLVSRRGIEKFNAQDRPRGRPPGPTALPKAS